MANIKFYIFLLVTLVAGNIYTASAQLDSAVYQLQGVEIFGKPAEVYAAGSRISTVDSVILSRYNSGTLSQLLQSHTPLYVKQYGPGGVSTVTFRGTTAQHTAVLWNGLNIASPSLGLSDLATIPVNGIGSLTVQHGSASAIYGSGAIGGAVLLHSPEYSDGLQLTAQQGIGSFNQYFSKVALSYGNNAYTVGGSIFWQKAENNFSYHDLSRVGAPETKQEHAALLRKGFTQDLTWKVSKRGKLSLHSWYTAIDREIQPAMGASHNDAAYTDRNFRLMAGYDQQNWLGEASLKAAYFSDYLHYSSNSLSSVTHIKTYQAQAEQTYIYGNRWNLQAGANTQYFVADVDGYGSRVTENRTSVFLLTRFNPTERLSLSLNLRQTLADGYTPPPTPALGASWLVSESETHRLYLKGNVAGSYRLPTLNERFWRPGGDPNLKPEQGFQAEAGVAHVFELEAIKLETEITPYSMLINNWVEWRSSNSISTPVNLQRVRAQGVEMSSRISRKMQRWLLAASLGYTYSSSEQVASHEGNSNPGKQLAYVPLHKATTHASISYNNWHMSGSVLYNSKRFTSASNTTALSAFALLDLSLGKSFSVGGGTLQTSLEVNNVTNTVYQTMQNYAMPLRNYNLQISYSILQSSKNK